MKLPITLALVATLLGHAQQMERIAAYRGLGGLVASAVGPGRVAGTERFYISYLYVDNTIDVVGVDPRTGEHQVFANPAPGESGARCMAVGPDGSIYLGTLPKAHFLKLDVKAGKLIDLGRPSSTEEYIWDVNFGSDGKLYGATYPQSKLVRYDPASGALEDLGRLDPVEQYAHYVAGNDDGFVYVGIGTSKANFAAYEIKTGEHREIMPAQWQVVGQAFVHRGRDGKVYGHVGEQHFRLEGWTAVPIPASESVAPVPKNALRNGDTVSVEEGKIRVTAAKTGGVAEHPYRYEGNLLNIFRIAFAPGGALYGSSILPIQLMRLDEKKSSLDYLGPLGGGEIYSFLSYRGKLLGAAYAGVAPLMIFDPQRPFEEKKNPGLVDFKGSDTGWRPQAMIEGPDGKVYLGAVSGYGKLGGPLVSWDVTSSEVVLYPNLVRDQSVVSLVAWKGLIIGGTTTGGGGGSHPTEKDARLFIWDPKTRSKTFEMVPVPGASNITCLTLGGDGFIYGIGGSKLLVFDPAEKRMVATRDLPFSGAIFNAIGKGFDGALWGLTSTGIFRIDPGTHEVTLVAKAPKKITAGFAIRGREIFFASGPEVWRYTAAAAAH